MTDQDLFSPLYEKQLVEYTMAELVDQAEASLMVVKVHIDTRGVKDAIDVELCLQELKRRIGDA